MAVGDPSEGKTPLGAVVDQKTVTHVNGLIDDATAAGAVVIAGGKAEHRAHAGDRRRWRHRSHEAVSR